MCYIHGTRDQFDRYEIAVWDIFIVSVKDKNKQGNGMVCLSVIKSFQFYSFILFTADM